jgi:hypothetical protein
LIGTSWNVIFTSINGNGNKDEFDIDQSTPRKRARSLMIRTDQTEIDRGYGIYEIKVYGCGQVIRGSFGTSTRRNAVQPLKSLSPLISSISPSQGSTAGGKIVTILGSFGAQTMNQLHVDFGGFPCMMLMLQDSNSSQQIITCKSSASGVINGGLKYVRVVSVISGASVLNKQFVFNYIDAWSARTTWGGSAPPVGCGGYSVDPDCQDSVVIPEGQVVLLDVSPPRLFLLLIQGTLIFDRKDIHLQVSTSLLFE